ncbi:RES domain-containing protein [Promicromonospora sp. NPDC090134]|uniref:RES domain-containing protein n=1 Tax=Promicromonospora sp. NPDC090134 TaxID=3364408 RepID=UPI00382669D6
MEFDPIGQTDDTMCLRHITDRHLLRRVEQFATSGACTICVTASGQVINLEHLAQVVYDFAERTYDHDGFRIEGEQLQSPMDTEEIVERLLADAIEPAVLDPVAGLMGGLIHEELDWFEPFDMDHNAGVEFEWDDFEQSIKHESRLLSPAAGAQPETAPERNHEFVRSLLVFAEKRAGLVRAIGRGTELHRARIERDARKLERDARESPAGTLGPAPAERVSAGRMNAQGVPMLYVAQDVETACAEVASHSPYDEAVVGTFILQRTLHILDLTLVPPPRSVFDDTIEEGDNRLNSLGFYRDRITRPVILDGNHPVDYVASQILTEAFRWWTSPRLDGIAYPSRVREGGTNIVLFFGDPIWFETVGETKSRLTRYQRHDKHGAEDPLFVIDHKTVRRYRVNRALTVERSVL